MTFGDDFQDFLLNQITYAVGTTPVSQFTYGRDVTRAEITTWTQQAGTQAPSIFNFGYDSANQLLSATVTNSGALVNTYGFAYDASGNRLSEQAGGSNNTATYNALNQITTGTAPGVSHTNEWDAAHRLTAVNAGNQRTEFTYDGLSRIASIRQLVNGSEISFRRFVWCDERICEERDAAGSTIT